MSPLLAVAAVAALVARAPLQSPITGIATTKTTTASATMAHQHHEWTPLQDAARKLTHCLRAMLTMTGSDLMRFSLGFVRASSHDNTPSSSVGLMNSLDRWIGEPVPGEDALLLPGVRVRLPDVNATAYLGAVQHSYVANHRQIERIGGHGSSDAVTKLVVARRGAAFGACVPREPSVDLIVSGRAPILGALRSNGWKPRNRRPRDTLSVLLRSLSIPSMWRAVCMLTCCVGVGGHARRCAQMVGKNQARTAPTGQQGAWLLAGADRARTHVHVSDDMRVDADLVFERLEAGAHIHCCSSKGLEPLTSRILSEEAQFRGLDWRDKLAEWTRNGQIHTECMCKTASEEQEVSVETPQKRVGDSA